MSSDTDNAGTSDITGTPGNRVGDAGVQPAPGRNTAAGRLAGKVAMITGAATGLGRVGAERFAAEGAAVVVADVSDPAPVVAAIEAAGGRAIGVYCDVTDAEAVRAAVAAAEEHFGKLDVMYNNAGISMADDDGPTNTSREVWQRTLEVNVIGVAECCSAGIPALQRAGGGSIINVASFVAHLGAATPQIAYTASKGAVLSMTREIATVYARENIRANALCPGPVLTPLLAKYMADEAARERRLVQIPMGRFGQPEEIVSGALFLASDEASFMTGQSLLIDGGITAAYTTPE